MDKNCGLAIIETEFLTKRNISDHLSNQDVHIRLSRREALGQLEGVERLIEAFISKYSEMLSKAEKQGLAQYRGTMPRFYTTIKVHKTVEEKIPHPFRPIVTACGTALAILSRWLDHKLQQLEPH